MILCRVLGPVEVVVDGGPAPAELLWRKNLALLVYLARSPGRARSREHLIGLLWGDKPESAARHSLNEAMRVVRKYGGESSLESEGPQVRLQAEAVELDAEGFERFVAEGNWSGAAALVSGEFMEGFGVPGCSEFEDWLYAERQRLREASLSVLVSRVEELLDGGETRGAAALSRRAMALDPLSELAARAAMRSIAIAGDRVGALSVYETFVAHLEREIGIEPDEDTQALAERVRRERSWIVPERLVEAPDTGAESRRVPLVGREIELERLVGAWTSCRRDRQAALAIIDGDAGTGKSRLAEELLARARLDGAAVATARAVEADAGEPWSGVLALARGVPLDTPGLADAPQAARATLASQIAEWAEMFTAETKGASLPLVRAFADVLASITDEQPAFLLLDDAQFVDRESLLAVGGLLRDLERAPLFVLISAAPQPQRSELEEMRAHLGRELRGVSLTLKPLSAEALRSLARWALPGYDDVELDRVVRRVSTDSAGLPLLVVELFHAIALGLDVSSATGAWPEPFRTLSQSLPGDLPDAVIAAVRVGFRRLSRNAQTALAAAAVLEERVEAATLGRVTGLEPEALAAALDELEWQRWLTADARGYSYVARIVRDIVVRDMVTAGQRQRILEAVQGSP